MTTAMHLKPKTIEELARLLKHSSGTKQRLNPVKAEVMDDMAWLDISELKEIVKYKPADATIRVQSGMTMGRLYAETAKYGQTLPLSYPDDMTLLEVVAADMPAPETGVYGMGGGYPRDFILGMEIATTDGELTKCGGDVVKNVTGYDLVKFYTGSHNTLGIVATVALKLAGLPETSVAKVVPLEKPEDGLTLFAELQKNSMPLVAFLLQKEKNDWKALLRFSGYRNLVDDAVKRLGMFSSQKPSHGVNQDLTDALFGANSVLQAEIAVPPGRSGMLETLQEFPVRPDKVCLNPAAGLMRLQWQEVSLSSSEGLIISLNRLSHDLHAEGGFIQLLRFPAVPGFSELAKNLNLPFDEINRELMRRFKTLYDPNAVLHSRVLPL